MGRPSAYCQRDIVQGNQCQDQQPCIVRHGSNWGAWSPGSEFVLFQFLSRQTTPKANFAVDIFSVRCHVLEWILFNYPFTFLYTIIYQLQMEWIIALRVGKVFKKLNMEKVACCWIHLGTLSFSVLMQTIGKNIVFIKFSAAANFLGQKRIALENFREHFFNCSNKENKQEIEIFAFVRKAYNMVWLVSHQI